LSDPPYNLAIPGVVSGKGRVKHENFVMASRELSRDEFIDFLSRFIAAAKPHLLDGALALLFMDWRHIAELLSAGEHEGLVHRQLLVWEKSNPAMGALWRNAHELVPVFKHGEAPNVDNVQLGKFGRNRSNVLHYPGANVPTKGRRRALEMHATVKPIALIADLILDVTNPGDLVLDCFGGSGTTLMAADAVGRDACLCELDPRYVDTIVQRWMRKSSEEAILEATGEPWSLVHQARSAEMLEVTDA
jgi:DNA modification methylase